MIAALAAFTGACVGGGDSGPTAHPDEVVREAPDITVATKSAEVSSAAPGFTATGSVVFETGADEITVQSKPNAEPPFGVTQPAAVLDLLRGVVAVYPYGGAEVQGVGTKRYELDIDLAKAIAATPASRQADLRLLDGRIGKDDELWADVFVDAQGRVRRILLPVHTAMIRPHGKDDHIPQLVSVDYSNFGTSR